MTDNTGQAPPGWYADTTQPGTERWWDGQAWTDHVRPAAVAPPPPPPPPAADPFSSYQPSTEGHQGVVGPPQVQSNKGSGCFGIATGVMVGIVAAVVLLVGGCVVVIASGFEAANEELADVATTIVATQTTIEGDGLAGSDTADGAVTPGGATGDGLDDVVSCVRADPQTIVLDVVNNTAETTSYVLTVGFFDEAGNRLADEPMFLNHLRPGERAIEEQFTFDEQGTVCEVLDVDRFPAGTDAADMAQASACEMGSGPDVLGAIEASLSVTNSASETSDFTVDVAFVDGDGVRRGSGATYIEAVRAGETAPGDVFTVLDHSDGYTCEVVAVTRLPS